MELGATTCTIHQAPSCHTCPIQMHCQAFQRVQESEKADKVLQSGEEAPSVSDYPVKVVQNISIPQDCIKEKSQKNSPAFWAWRKPPEVETTTTIVLIFLCQIWMVEIHASSCDKLLLCKILNILLMQIRRNMANLPYGSAGYRWAFDICNVQLISL